MINKIRKNDAKSGQNTIGMPEVMMPWSLGFLGATFFVLAWWLKLVSSVSRKNLILLLATKIVTLFSNLAASPFIVDLFAKSFDKFSYVPAVSYLQPGKPDMPGLVCNKVSPLAGVAGLKSIE